MATHYDVLGVARTASHAEIRDSYRRAARRHHPDAGGRPEAMAEVNRAWQVLGDPAARREYDRSLATPEPGVDPIGPARNTPAPPVRRRFDPFARYQDPLRVPWRPLLVIGCLGALAVFASAALERPPEPIPVDNLLEPGSCVTIENNGDAAEASCGAAHDAVVVELVGRAEDCPAGTDAHRDRQGLGIACVVVGRA